MFYCYSGAAGDWPSLQIIKCSFMSINNTSNVVSHTNFIPKHSSCGPWKTNCTRNEMTKLSRQSSQITCDLYLDYLNIELQYISINSEVAVIPFQTQKQSVSDYKLRFCYNMNSIHQQYYNHIV
ncbi:Hypothetical_protein [Hexamita inflata]|uniref:Hypothetical_protein n=1 Tax=Hexamita inflata TaxID=28002 RepID=A0AA86UVC9_9EUKA|nr:Hypothetical protein HINF_LOCUS53957 [Hexamita inflata]